MLVTLPEEQPQLRLRTACGGRFSHDAFAEFCSANPDLRLELNSEGEIIVMPPAGGESSGRSFDVDLQLGGWAKRDGSGRGFDSSAGFVLSDGSILSPDAAWVSFAALRALLPKQRRGFLPLCPEFVIEILSPSDRRTAAKQKMQTWIANGVKLGWLIDADARTVYVYRPNRPPRTRRGITELAGEGPMDGFKLDLREIWRGIV